MKPLLDFLAASDAELDTPCEDQVLPLTFAGVPWLGLAQALFGTGDLYDDPPAGP